MRRRSAIILAVLGLLLAVAPRASADAIGDIVAQVGLATYSGYLDDSLYTHAGDDRGYGPEHDLARTNIAGHFAGLGLATSLDAFTYSGGTYYNVVAVQTGSVRPGDVYVVGAHYDSFNNPGADDNASGVAAVMEAARVLAAYEFEATMMYVAFDREEQGLVGSTAWVAAHAADNILGMISLDMIAYNPPADHDKVRLYGHNASLPIKQDLADAVTAYGGGIVPVIEGAFDASDHAPFEAAGFQACLLIEYNLWANPHYHGAADNVDTAGYIDYAYATDLTRATVGWLAESAVLVPEPATLALLGFGLALLLRRRRADARP